MAVGMRGFYWLIIVLFGFSAVAQEKGHTVSFECEDFIQQTADDIRSWHITSAGSIPQIKPDGDPAHLDGASGGTYIEILPDTRRTHADKLIRGENFSPQPGKLAILKYKVQFPAPGKYYVWARAYSTGSEDNGFHVGLDGAWPETGQRWQTVVKKRWHWECKQRTEKVHVGVPMQLFLEIPSAGEHEILISMREDGCELDKIILATDRAFRPPGYHRQKAPKKALPKIETQPDGDGVVEVSGELKSWHKVTLTLDGPWAHEADAKDNPFTTFQFDVRFTHESGSPSYLVPGYFAADGNAAETSAESGTKWRAHLSPDKPGKWQYEVLFSHNSSPALGDKKTGSFTVAANDKPAPDLRARGRLKYTGERYLKFAGDGTYFLKAGPDAPESFLAYTDFDGTRANTPSKGPLKSWQPHLRDWNEGDPVWKNGKGKAIIGAVNYLSEKGLNAFSFLSYNAGGDGDNVWPFIDRDMKFNYDCSKLDQWGIVFDHATSQGMYLHFKLQETEIDDNRRGHKSPKNTKVVTSLDGGKLGPERKLYLRELIARFGHNLALNWNIGEENTQSPEEIKDMINYIRKTDPYGHHIVIHTYPNQQDKIYPALLGDQSELSGASLQNPWDKVHKLSLKWINQSAKAGKKWVVANDEQNPADLGVPPDPGYQGHSGQAEKEGKTYNLHDVRRETLWGNLMAGGAGVEYYFGYKLPENDLRMEDYRSRDKSWDFCRTALNIYTQSKIPFWEMSNADALVGNPQNESGKPWCLAKPGEAYIVYMPANQKTAILDMSAAEGSFRSTAWAPFSNDQSGVSSEILASGKIELTNPYFGKEDGNGDCAITIQR